MNAVRSQRAERRVPVTRAAPATATTIYVALQPYPGCASETGIGTRASPFCSLQDGVNAAAAGDTVEVSGSTQLWNASVTVTTSDISIVGANSGATLTSGGDVSSALILDGVSNVSVSNMKFVDSHASDVSVIGSSGVTFTGDELGTLHIDGASSHVSVLHSVDVLMVGLGGSGISIASGAHDVTVAANVLGNSSVTGTGVVGLDVTGNTIQRSCGSGIDIEGASTGVFIENNLFEDSNDLTGTNGDGGGFGTPVNCHNLLDPWLPDITVAAAAVAGTATDYNDFYIGSGASAPYLWAGTTYATLADFQAGAGQESHGTLETVQPGLVDIWPSDPIMVNATLSYTSAANGTANVSAPGEPSSDFYGVTPYDSRGAMQYVSPDPELSFSLSARDASGFDVFLLPELTSKNVTLSDTTWWGDGTTTVFPSFQGPGATLGVYHTYAQLGTYTIKVTVTDNAGDTATNSVTIETAGAEYTAYGPTRVLDTRKGTGTSGSTTPVAAGGTLKLALDGVDGIPSGVSAVAMNLTVTNPKAGGYVTAYPSGGTKPTTSSLNFSAGQTVANMAVVPVGPDGTIELYNGSGGTVALVADVSGYFVPVNSQGYTVATPDRLLDTRDGTGGYPYPTVRAGTPVRLKVAGVDGIPAGVTAVAVNLTIASPSAGGYISAFPDGQPQPTVSNLNFAAAQTVANAAIVPVGADGYIDLAIAGGPARLIADVYGYFSVSGASAYVPVWPFRFLDSRKIPNGALPGGDTYLVEVGHALTGINSWATITGSVVNATVTDTAAGGYLAVFPDTSDLGNQPLTVPQTSTLNFTPHATVADLALPALPTDGTADFYNGSGGSLQLIVDVDGYFIAG